MSSLPASIKRIGSKTTEKRRRHLFPHYKSMGAFCCHGNQGFGPIRPKTLCSLSPTPVMLHIKGLRAFRRKKTPPLKLVYLFIFCILPCRLQNRDFKKYLMAIQLEKSRGRRAAIPMHFNVSDLHCLDRKNSQKLKFSQHNYFIIFG